MRIKTCIVSTFLVFLSTLSFAQFVNRLSKETAEQFARFKPDNSVIAHPVIATIWNSKPVIISFYSQAYKLPTQNYLESEVYHRTIATIFVKGINQEYERSIIDTIPNEGGDPHIESVFFANADKDQKTEMIIISSWLVRHLDVSGTLYATSIYGHLNNRGKGRLSLLKALSDRLSGGFECIWSDGTSKVSKYRTAVDVKKELKRLGY